MADHDAPSIDAEVDPGSAQNLLLDGVGVARELLVCPLNVTQDARVFYSEYAQQRNAPWLVRFAACGQHGNAECEGADDRAFRSLCACARRPEAPAPRHPHDRVRNHPRVARRGRRRRERDHAGDCLLHGGSKLYNKHAMRLYICKQ